MHSFEEIQKDIIMADSEDILIKKAKMMEFIEIVLCPFILGLIYFSISATLPYHIINYLISRLDDSDKWIIILRRVSIALVSGMIPVVWKLVYNNVKIAVGNLARFAWDVLNAITSKQFMKNRIKANKKMILSRYLKHMQDLYERYALLEYQIVRKSILYSALYVLIYVVLFFCSTILF